MEYFINIYSKTISNTLIYCCKETYSNVFNDTLLYYNKNNIIPDVYISCVYLMYICCYYYNKVKNMLKHKYLIFVAGINYSEFSNNIVYYISNSHIFNIKTLFNVQFLIIRDIELKYFIVPKYLKCITIYYYYQEDSFIPHIYKKGLLDTNKFNTIYDKINNLSYSFRIHVCLKEEEYSFMDY